MIMTVVECPGIQKQAMYVDKVDVITNNLGSHKAIKILCISINEYNLISSEIF